jgi:hypothetical protein
MDARRRNWQFVEREAAIVLRRACDLSATTVSEHQSAAALDDIIRAADRLKTFAQRRIRGTL